MTIYTRPPADGHPISRYMQLEVHERENLDVEGIAPAPPYLRGPRGNIRTGALLTMIDNVGGLGGGLAALPDGWVVSTNLAARVVTTTHIGPLRVDAQLLRRGRNSVVSAVQIHDAGADDALIADGVLTSAILVPANGPPQWPRPMRLAVPEPDESPLPIPQWLGVRAATAGGVEMELADQFRNPWGILHGGVVAMLVDLAAEHATERTPTDVVLHFLAPNRVGPVRATARSVGARGGEDVCRVEVRDVGADRVTAVAVVTARG